MITLDQGKESILLIFLIIVAIASGLDLIADVSHGVDFAHLMKESAVTILALLGIAYILYEHKQQRQQIHQLKQDLQTASENTTNAKEYVLEGRKQLGKIIQQQFTDWHLTRSEAEVGLLILKGLSLKEIAILRETAEKTVRQQASSIYQKSGIAGRHAFSAWFIEDIL